MKQHSAIFFAFLGFATVIAQYVLILENRNASIIETTIRFFSFFTILTNTLVAFYFICLFLSKKQESKIFEKPGTLTAITVYITIVGLVYQVALRKIWQPEGLQLIVNELLHSVIPVLVIIYWCFFEKSKNISYSQILKWLIYPLIYLIYILVRGNFSDFYPYPFVDVNAIGLRDVIINTLGLLVLFTLTSAMFIYIGKLIFRR
ncbi:MAG: Pr6Pr family membrane protein [Flavobacterium sp.]|nr:Pr6Pr family membrane protein [Flavobacterium sp.]